MADGDYQRYLNERARREAVEAERDALRAAVRRVEAELARREKCAADERAAGRVCDYCEDFIPEVRAALGEPPADTWIPCCEHCGCTVDRSGHDDTCSYGCNDEPSAGGSTPDPADTDPRKLDADIALGVWQKGGSAYRCDVDGTDGNPRPCTHRDCWDSGDEDCGQREDHPVHNQPAPPADHIAIFDGPQRAAAESRLTEVRKFAELFGEVDGYLDRGFVRDTLLALLDGWIPPNPQLSDRGDDN